MAMAEKTWTSVREALMVRPCKPALETTPSNSSQSGDEDATPQLPVVAETQGRAIAVAIGAWCALFPVAGLLNTLGTFQTFVGLHQLSNYSEQEVGWIFSMYPFLLAFGAGQVGPFFDAYGLKWILMPGYIGFITAMVAFSFCTEYYQFFLSFGVLGGISSACIWTTSVATTGHWFNKYRGIATGAVTSGGPLGGIVFPLLFRNLEPLIGFAWTIRVIALICMVMGTIAMVLMRTRLPPSHKYNWSANFDILGEKSFFFTICAIFLIEFAYLIPAAYITPYALSQGMENSRAYQLLAFMNAAQIFGRLIPGWLADRWGRFNVMILSSLPCAVVILVLWRSATSTSTIVAFSILFGFLSGSAYSLAPVCISQLCRTEDYGSKCGTAYLFISPATLIGIPIAGAVLGDRVGQYQGSNFHGLILLCGLTYLASSIFFVLARVSGAGISVKKVF